MAWIAPAEPCTSIDGRHQREDKGSSQRDVLRVICPVCKQQWRKVDDDAPGATGG